MVGEEQEDIVVFGGFEDFSAAFSSDCGFVTLEDAQEESWVDAASFIVNDNACVDIDSGVGVGGFVEDFALEGIFNVVGDVIIGEGDDAFWGESVFFEDLVSVEDIGLVAIIGPGIGAGDQNGPVVGETDCEKAE